MKAKTCQNCCYAKEAMAVSRTILICSNKEGCEAKFFVVEPKGNCSNFKAGPTPPAPDNGARLIPLTQGKFAVVDAEDYERLAQHKWHCRKAKNNFYAFRRKQNKMVSMHREIINAPEGLLVDHIDGNGLNNRKGNVRLCTYAQNACNRRPNRNTRSKYKGVSFHKRDKKWEAQIMWNGKGIYLGRFDNEIEAAVTYDRKAEELFGEFAYLNFAKGRE